MTRLTAHLACGLHMLGGLLPAVKAAEPLPPVVNGLSQAAVQNAFQILQRDYIQSDQLTFSELNRAALAGLLDRLSHGATIVKRSESRRAELPTGLVAVLFGPSIGYARMQSFQAEDVTALRGQLAEWKKQKVEELVLDLRSLDPAGDFETAEKILESFVPDGEVLFQMKQVGHGEPELHFSHASPVWPGALLVLVDLDTGVVGETVAAVLRLRKQAILIGARTKGATVVFETQPLDEAWALRFARAEMVLPDGTSLFGRGILPDFAVPLSSASKNRLFGLGAPVSWVKESVQDQPVPRFNEAALVAGKNPDLEAYLRQQKSGEAGAKSPSAGVPRDWVLQRALDMLISKRHFQATKLEWKQPPPGPQPTVRKGTKAP